MKKRISLIAAMLMAVCMLLSGCKKSNAVDLTAGVKNAEVTPVSDLSEDSAAVTDFGLRLFQNSMTEGENTLISPLSVLCALAMTANGAGGETLAQMENVLGLPVETLNDWLYTYLNQLPQEENGKLCLANAVWFKEDPCFAVEPSFLQVNADYYNADLYEAPFDASTLDDINRWVSKNTDGMIPDILDKIPEDAVMYLVNALAFDAQWQKVYQEPQVREGSFTTEDGQTQTVQQMYSTEYQYLEDGSATGFIKYYAGGGYAFAALLPNEGISVAEYAGGLTGEGLQEMLSNAQSVDVHASIPKFETACNKQMGEVLQDMGMTDAFDRETADFSRLGSYTDQNIYINCVIHKTFLSLGAQGTKAGAATAVGMEAGAAMIEQYKEVMLDRPFVYLLIDCEASIPLFIGAMMDVNGD